MTVKGLHKYIVCRKTEDQDNGRNKHFLYDGIPPGMETAAVAVDGNSFLHAAIKSVRAAELFHTRPKVRNDEGVLHFQRRHRVLISNGLTPVFYCFDGLPNDHKHATNTERTTSAADANTKLAALLVAGRPQSFDEVTALRKLVAFPDAEFIADVIVMLRTLDDAVVVQAPLEAEQQMVALEKDGIVNVLLSEDGDVLCLGGKRMITLVQWHHDKPRESSCCLYEADKIWARQSAGGGRWSPNWLPELSCFLGNDYIPNLFGLGPEKGAILALESYIKQKDGSERLSMLDYLEKTKSWSREEAKEHKIATGFAAKFEHMAAFIRHVPVFHFAPALIDIPMNFRDWTTISVTIVPLNPLPVGLNRQEEWGRLIGLTNDPNTFLGDCSDKLLCIASMEINAKTRKHFQQVPVPRLPHPPFKELARGSYLDFSHCPPELQPIGNLKRFLFVRGLMPKGKVTQGLLVQIVQDMVALERRVPGSIIHPRQLSSLTQDSASYQKQESLKPREGLVKLVWCSDKAKILSEIRRMAFINDDTITTVFGPGRNGIRFRARHRLLGGNYDVRSLHLAYVTAEGQTGRVNAVAVKIKVTPSMKADDYWATLVLHDQEDGSILPAPNTRCECPTGCTICSHLVGFMAIVHVIQTRVDWGINELAMALPQAIKSVVKTPIPWWFAFAKDCETGSKRKNISIQLPDTAPRKRRRSCDNSFTDVSPVSATTTFFAAESINDVEDSNNDQDKVDEFTEEESDQDDITEVDDVESEKIALQEKLSGDDLTKFFPCKDITGMIKKAEENGVVDGVQSFEHKLNTCKINAANASNLAGVGGPNESVESKQKQLEFHERLYQLHLEEKHQEKKTVLSHYVTAMKQSRDRWFAQWLASMDVEIVMPVVRLAKVPPKTHVLADRGFASCATYYPHLNSMVTPYFIDGRSQFTIEEVSADREKCKLRYACEAIFSRVWSFCAVRDKVGRNFMDQLHHFVNYAHGMANFFKPFYQPGRDNYFSKEWNGNLSMGQYKNYIDYAVPKEYMDANMADTSVLNDGKDFETDTVRVNPAVTRASYSDKIKSSGGRIITWSLPTGIVFEHTGLYLGRAPEIRLVELWGGAK